MVTVPVEARVLALVRPRLPAPAWRWRRSRGRSAGRRGSGRFPPGPARRRRDRRSRRPRIRTSRRQGRGASDYTGNAPPGCVRSRHRLPPDRFPGRAGPGSARGRIPPPPPCGGGCRWATDGRARGRARPMAGRVFRRCRRTTRRGALKTRCIGPAEGAVAASSFRSGAACGAAMAAAGTSSRPSAPPGRRPARSARSSGRAADPPCRYPERRSQRGRYPEAQHAVGQQHHDAGRSLDQDGVAPAFRRVVEDAGRIDGGDETAAVQQHSRHQRRGVAGIVQGGFLQDLQHIGGRAAESLPTPLEGEHRNRAGCGDINGHRHPP